jgi:hypothetical protein
VAGEEILQNIPLDNFGDGVVLSRTTHRNRNPKAVVFNRVIQIVVFQAGVKIQINNPNTRTKTRTN